MWSQKSKSVKSHASLSNRVTVVRQEEQFLEATYAALGRPRLNLPPTRAVESVRAVMKHIQGQPVIIKKGKRDLNLN
jgi:hypothetical protein